MPCILRSAGSSGSVAGNGPVVNLALSFHASFSGAKNVYMYAAASVTNTGWQTMGAWTAQ